MLLEGHFYACSSKRFSNLELRIGWSLCTGGNDPISLMDNMYENRSRSGFSLKFWRNLGGKIL